jgi:hypothetical protein
LAHYVKPFMSITELTKLGLSRDYLKRISGIYDAPIIKTLGGGKIYFKTSELDAFLDEVTKRDKIYREARRYIKRT